MKRTRANSPALRWLAAGVGVAALYATRAGFTWLHYGNPQVRRWTKPTGCSISSKPAVDE